MEDNKLDKAAQQEVVRNIIERYINYNNEPSNQNNNVGEQCLICTAEKTEEELALEKEMAEFLAEEEQKDNRGILEKIGDEIMGTWDTGAALLETGVLGAANAVVDAGIGIGTTVLTPFYGADATVAAQQSMRDRYGFPVSDFAQNQLSKGTIGAIGDGVSIVDGYIENALRGTIGDAATDAIGVVANTTVSAAGLVGGGALVTSVGKGAVSGAAKSGTTARGTRSTSTAQGNRPYLSPNSRPSFRQGVAEQVFERARGSDGLVRDPTGTVINWRPGEPRLGVWDMGHVPGSKYSDMHRRYVNGEFTPAEFRDWYNDPIHYRPEMPSTNRGHGYE